jgi:hopanoid biosynthesis associated RND transporter like protein HpnN
LVDDGWRQIISTFGSNQSRFTAEASVLSFALVEKIVRVSIYFRISVFIVSALSVCLASYYTVGHFAITTDTRALISDRVPWRQLENRFNAAFPNRSSLTLIVIDAFTAEQADQAADQLSDHLKGLTKIIRSIRRPNGGEFFERNGLLFLTKDELASVVNQLLSAQPFLGSLAADPSLRGLMHIFSLMAMGVRDKDTTFDAMVVPVRQFADSFEALTAGRSMPFSWHELLTGKAAVPADLRRLIVVQPVLDFSALQPGAAASQAIRRVAHDLNLENGVRVRLTGDVPLADEEFATLSDGAFLNGVVTIAIVVLILRLALRSFKIIAAVSICLLVGLSVTAAVGLWLVHALNLISVAFAVLFVGLGVDFGLQFSVRYREERHRRDEAQPALLATAHHAGGPLALAAASTATGFYAFLPTAYQGISELGLIAGTGMIIAFLTSISLLPALLSVFNTPAEPRPMGYGFLAPIDDLLARHRHAVLIVFAVLAGALAPLLANVRFDFNPLNLRSSQVESVATFLDLLRDPTTSPNTIDIESPSLQAAAALAERLAALPEVARAVTLNSFVPDDQEAKLEQIQDLNTLLGPSLDPPSIAPAPTDSEIIDAIRAAATALREAASGSDGPGPRQANHLATVLSRLADAPLEQRQQAAHLLLPSFAHVLAQTQKALTAEPISLDNLPPDLIADWVNPDGRARIELFANGNSNDNAVLRKFVDAVTALAPDAIGTAVAIQQSGKTIVRAFIEAGLCAIVTIALLLYVALRRLSDVMLTLVPLLLAGIVTLEICGLIDLPLNFANILALPLLLGVGVAFKIYFVMAWRAGQTQLLQSSLTRAVFFSAMTTATAFGSLWLSKHPGTSGMGKLMALSLLTTMIAAVIFQPALMGPPRPT